jgi:hypothetical protein
MISLDNARERLGNFYKFEILCSTAIALLFIAICSSSMLNMTLTTDESAYFDVGKKALLGDFHIADMQRTPITIINAIFSNALHINIMDGRLSNFIVRFPTVLAGALLGFYVMIWSRSMYGTAGMFLSLVLYAFCPNIIAHTRLVTTDIYCALFIFMSIYHFTRYMRTGRKTDYLSLVFACGLAIVSKQTSLLLLVIIPAIAALYIFYDNTLKTRCSPLRILLAFAGILFTINIIYGFYFYSLDISRLSPNLPLSRLYLPLPQVFVDEFKLGIEYNRNGWATYLLGRYSTTGWWYYFPVIFILKMPLSFLVILSIALFTYKYAYKSLLIDEVAIIVAMLAIFIFYAFLCNVQIGIRYILPIFPFIFTLTGRAGLFFTMKNSLPIKMAITILAFCYVISSMSYYPHFIQYGNELLTNRLNLYKYFADSNLDWGQSDYYLDQYVANMLAKNCTVHVNPEEPVSGIVAVNATAYLGVSNSMRRRYTWLKGFKPIDQVAYNWLIFDTTSLDLKTLDTSSKVSDHTTSTLAN